MNINFPLILVLATAATGLIWLLEIFWLKPRRQAHFNLVPDDEDANFDRPGLVEYSISFFPVLALVLALRSFLFEPFQIPTGSMIPTLEVGDFVLVSKYEYGIRLPVIGTKIWDVGEPENGDIMVFIPPHKDEYFIKRVVGIPGDRVRYENKLLYINGKEQTQTFVGQYPPVSPRVLRYREKLGEAEHLIEVDVWPGRAAREWVIPEGTYFMMGDNRDDSSDSRDWGEVSEDDIVGKAVAIWLHKEPGFRLPGFSRNRWLE